MPATCSFCHQFLICSFLALPLQLLPLQLLVWFPPSSQPLLLALAELPQGGRRELAWKCGLELAWGFSLFILTEKKHLSWGAVLAIKLLYCSSRGPDDGSPALSGISEAPVSPAPGNQVCSSSLWVALHPCTQKQHTHESSMHTHAHTHSQNINTVIEIQIYSKK